MAKISPEAAGGKNVVAFLDMLAWSEGTDNGRQQTKDHGYDVLVGGGLFTDYSRHPNRLIKLNPKLSSTAAGRYQLLYRWHEPYIKLLKVTGFDPLVQDMIAIQQIKERRALDLIKQGDIKQAIARCSNIWASLPGAGYGQHEQKLDALLAVYKSKGGELAAD